MNKFLLQMAKGNKVTKFKDLPKPYQYAIIHYMAFDGEAWDLPEGYDEEANAESRDWFEDQKFNRAYIKKNVKYWADKYCDATFGMLPLSKGDTLKALKELHSEALNNMDELDGDNLADPKYYNEKWPVILSSFDDEFIEDGWHRLSVYLRSTMRKIPAIYYAS